MLEGTNSQQASPDGGGGSGEETKTPAATTRKKPIHISRKSLELYEKWKKEAEKLGSATIVVSKVAAQKLIYDHLYSSRCPKTIARIYRDLKGVIPKAILKVCLDEMISTEPKKFAGTLCTILEPCLELKGPYAGKHGKHHKIYYCVKYEYERAAAA